MFSDIKKSRLQQVKTRQRRDLHLSFERKGDSIGESVPL